MPTSEKIKARIVNLSKEIKIKDSEDIYQNQVFQCINPAESYGYLVKIKTDEIAGSDLNPRDIVILDSIPINIPVIGGIITTERQTPLSHINVLSRNRNTPNLYHRNAWTDPLFCDLVDKLVYFKVDMEGYIIREGEYHEEIWRS